MRHSLRITGDRHLTGHGGSGRMFFVQGDGKESILTQLAGGARKFVPRVGIKIAAPDGIGMGTGMAFHGESFGLSLEFKVSSSEFGWRRIRMAATAEGRGWHEVTATTTGSGKERRERKEEETNHKIHEPHEKGSEGWKRMAAKERRNARMGE